MQPSVIVFWLVHKQNTIAIRMILIRFPCFWCCDTTFKELWNLLLLISFKYMNFWYELCYLSRIKVWICKWVLFKFAMVASIIYNIYKIAYWGKAWRDKIGHPIFSNNRNENICIYYRKSYAASRWNERLVPVYSLFWVCPWILYWMGILKIEWIPMLQIVGIILSNLYIKLFFGFSFFSVKI